MMRRVMGADTSEPSRDFSHIPPPQFRLVCPPDPRTTRTTRWVVPPARSVPCQSCHTTRLYPAGSHENAHMPYHTCRRVGQHTKPPAAHLDRSSRSRATAGYLAWGRHSSALRQICPRCGRHMVYASVPPLAMSINMRASCSGVICVLPCPITMLSVSPTPSDCPHSGASNRG